MRTIDQSDFNLIHFSKKYTVNVCSRLKGNKNCELLQINMDYNASVMCISIDSRSKEQAPREPDLKFKHLLAVSINGSFLLNPCTSLINHHMDEQVERRYAFKF